MKFKRHIHRYQMGVRDGKFFARCYICAKETDKPRKPWWVLMDG